jgi:gliding motility-associated-like protein
MQVVIIYILGQLRIILAALFIILFVNTFGQLNLVKNPDFIDNTLPNPLPTCGGSLRYCDGVVVPTCYFPYLTHWFRAVTTTPDYFYNENQVGIISYFNNGSIPSNYREIIGTKLKKKLNPDFKYRIELEFSFCAVSKFAINRMGILFTNDSISTSNYILGEVPQIEVDSNQFYESIHKIDTIFSPTESDIEFLYVGNFYPNEQMKIKTTSGSEPYSYYLINYVNVIEVDTVYKKASINDTIICEGNSVQLNSREGRYWRNYSWYTDDGFVSNNLNVTVSPKQTTTYYLYTTDTIHAPHTRLDSVTLTVLPFNVTLTDKNITLCGGDTVILENVPQSGYNYKWQPAQYLSIDTIAQPYLQLPWYLESETINYTVTVTNNSNNCSDNFKYNVVVNFCPDSLEPQIYIPNVFSPNGDGENDEFKLTTQNIKNLKAAIYNRWGTLINTINGIEGKWQGKTIAGDNAPTGIYYVIITAEGMDKKTYHYSGYVHLY